MDAIPAIACSFHGRPVDAQSASALFVGVARATPITAASLTCEAKKREKV